MAQRDETPAPTWQDYAANMALSSLVGSLRLLPVRTRLRLVGALTHRVIAPLLGWDKRVRANLAHVWPQTSEKDADAIARGAIRNLGRALIENYDPLEIRSRGARYPLTGAGLPALEKARAEGRPVVLISGHYGSPICAVSAMVERGYTVGGFLRPLSNAYANTRYTANYRMISEPIFEQSRRGTMGMLKHIRDGGMVALLFDVFDSSGTPIPFLGQPAPTALSAAEIALKTDALLMTYFGVRHADGYGFDAIIEEPIPHTTPLEMMTEATRRLEARIEQDPTQWMWTHRRWKPKRQAKRQRKRAAATM